VMQMNSLRISVASATAVHLAAAAPLLFVAAAIPVLLVASALRLRTERSGARARALADAVRRKTMLCIVACLLAPAVTAQSQSAADYVIGPQDVLTVQVFDQADLGGKYTVETDG